MRWWVFLLILIVAAGLDSGLASLFTLRGLGHATPSMAACVLVFVALQARPRVALWAAWVIGVVLDLGPTAAGAAGGMPVIGPHALGAVAAAYVVLLLRPVVFRKRLVTVAVLAGVVSGCMGLGAAAIETIRWWMPWTHALAPPPAAARLTTIGFSAIYTALIGVPIGALLLAGTRWWRFDSPPGRLDYAGSRR